MAARSLKVEFLPTDAVDGVRTEAQVHDVSLPDAAEGVPEVLENPHVDFPGTWRLVGEGAGGAHRYQRVERVADSNDTLAG